MHKHNRMMCLIAQQKWPRALAGQQADKDSRTLNLDIHLDQVLRLIITDHSEVDVANVIDAERRRPFKVRAF